ncbi:MAG: TIGR00645 family protein [Pseudomonadota bacterium]
MSDTSESNRITFEEGLERGLFNSRWLMAPMYMGLVVCLAMLTFVFLRELAYYMPQVLTMSADKTILVVLTLIDLSLAANLLLIVLFSGYENFVSKLDLGDHTDKPDWMGTVDFQGLKMKLIASIVAISGIHLLKRFMEVGQPEADAMYGDQQLMWLVILHMGFVLSGVLLAFMDWLSASAKAKLRG